jgi:uncharacterized repeat protein (TIGR01451 family)
MKNGAWNIIGWHRTALAISAAAFCNASAWAECPAANQYNFSFATQPAATLNYANTYSYNATSTALGSQSFSVNWITNGLSSSVVAGAQMPAISNLITDGVAAQNLVVGAIFTGRTADLNVNTRVVVTRFTFPTPIRDFSVQINDIDFTTNQFRDWLQVNGINGAASYNPSLTTPHGNNNSLTGPSAAAASSQLIGATTTPVALTVRQSAGTGGSGNNANTGTITATFAQPVTTVEVRYGNYPLQTGETATGQQALGIQSISYCPMPALTVSKTSTVMKDGISSANPKSIPGADVVYSLTVSNSNSSPVDLNQTILADLLPPNLTFYNGDIDDAGPLTGNFEFIPGTSGLTLAPGNISYTNNAGASYAYSPTAGYDGAVDGLRFNPQGSMAPNSTFTIRLRTRID